MIENISFLFYTNIKVLVHKQFIIVNLYFLIDKLKFIIKNQARGICNTCIVYKTLFFLKHYNKLSICKEN